MRLCVLPLLLLMFAAGGCAPAGKVRSDASERVISSSPANTDSAEVALLKEARGLIGAGQPSAAIEGPLQRLISGFEREPTTGKRVFCARTLEESLLYGADPENGADVLSWVWSEAYHLKSFALVELGRRDEAQAMAEKAVELSPSNASYLAELAHIQQIAGRSATALALFTRAETAARVASPDEVKTLELTRALRGQGYVLAEMWRLDEAEARYRASLEADPHDEKSRGEIEFVQTLRKQLDAGSGWPRKMQ